MRSRPTAIAIPHSHCRETPSPATTLASPPAIEFTPGIEPPRLVRSLNTSMLNCNPSEKKEVIVIEDDNVGFKSRSDPIHNLLRLLIKLNWALGLNYTHSRTHAILLLLLPCATKGGWSVEGDLWIRVCIGPETYHGLMGLEWIQLELKTHGDNTHTPTCTFTYLWVQLGISKGWRRHLLGWVLVRHAPINC